MEFSRRNATHGFWLRADEGDSPHDAAPRSDSLILISSNKGQSPKEGVEMSLKRRFVLRLSVAALLLVLVPTLAMAQGLQGRNSLSFSAGGLIGDTMADASALGIPGFDLIDVDDGFLLMFRYEYGVTDNIGVEIGAGGATNNLLDVGPAFPGGELEIDTGEFLFNGGLVFNLMTGRIVPFAAVGIGLVNFSGDEIDETDFSFNFGGGLKIYATDRWFFRVDVRDHVTYPEDAPPIEAETLHLIEISGGIGVTF